MVWPGSTQEIAFGLIGEFATSNLVMVKKKKGMSATRDKGEMASEVLQ